MCVCRVRRETPCHESVTVARGRRARGARRVRPAALRRRADRAARRRRRGRRRRRRRRGRWQRGCCCCCWRWRWCLCCCCCCCWWWYWWYWWWCLCWGLCTSRRQRRRRARAGARGRLADAAAAAARGRGTARDGRGVGGCVCVCVCVRVGRNPLICLSCRETCVSRSEGGSCGGGGVPRGPTRYAFLPRGVVPSRRACASRERDKGSPLAARRCEGWGGRRRRRARRSLVAPVHWLLRATGATEPPRARVSLVSANVQEILTATTHRHDPPPRPTATTHRHARPTATRRRPRASSWR